MTNTISKLKGTGMMILAFIISAIELSAQPIHSNLAQNNPIATSTFDSDDDGWKLFGDTQTGEIPDYFNTGGVPGGYIRAMDAGRPSPSRDWHWVAPAKFLGDVSSAYAQYLTFDLWQSSTDRQVDSDHVVLCGQGLRLSFNESYNPGVNWTAFAIPLIESAGWINQATGSPATVMDMLAVLSNLDSLLIRGEYQTGADTGGLDNVKLGVVLTSGPRISTFENENEDWQVIGDAQGGSGVSSYWPKDGVPDGYIYAVDDGLGTSWFWLAPQKFLGDASSVYSQFLIFDLKQSNTGNQFSFDKDVRLASGGDTLYYKIPYNPGTNWTAYAIPILETDGWTDQNTGQAPTHAKMTAVLSNLTGLIIRGEFRSGDDFGSLDNVVLGTPDMLACNYTLAPGSSSFSATGGSGGFMVMTDDTCSWSAVSQADWITITSGNTGAGNGSIEFSVAKNSSVHARSGLIRVEDRVFVVKQDGKEGKFRVYILSDGQTMTDAAVMDALTENDISATLGAQSHLWDGSQADLDSFDAVVLLNRENWDNGDMSLEGQAELVNFVSNGGGLVTGEWLVWNIANESRFSILNDIIPSIYAASFTSGSSTYEEITPDLILNKGLPPSFAFTTEGESYFGAKPGATIYYSSSNTAMSGLIGWRKDAGRVLNFSAIITHAEMADSNFARLFVNAVEWTARTITRTVRLKESGGAPGGVVEVPVCLTAQGDENAIGFSIEFDPTILSNPSAHNGADAVSGSVLTNSDLVGEGKFGAQIALPSGSVFEPGEREIMLLRFDILPNVTADSTELRFIDAPIPRQAVDAFANLVDAVWTDGVVRIADGYEADVAPRSEGDGAVLLPDWVQVGRFVARLDTPLVTPNEFQRADCAPDSTNGDGQLTVADYVQAGSYSAQLDSIPMKPAGGPFAPSTNALLTKNGLPQPGFRAAPKPLFFSPANNPGFRTKRTNPFSPAATLRPFRS